DDDDDKENVNLDLNPKQAEDWDRPIQRILHRTDSLFAPRTGCRRTTDNLPSPAGSRNSEAPQGVTMPAETVYVGRRIRVESDVLHTPDGRSIRRDAIRHPGAVVILPALDAEHVVLLKNFRFVIGETLWEVPAGTVEPNEPLEACARRELVEETGYQAAKWRSL